MDFLHTAFWITVVLFIATYVRSTIGFGDALLAMPLLGVMVSLQTATPLVAFMGLAASTVITFIHWDTVDLRSAWRLIVASLVGIPFGLVMLYLAPEGPVKLLLGVLVTLYGLYNLLRPGLPLLPHEKLAYPFGFIAGVLGGAYNTNGPPIVIYGTLRRWSPDDFRATLQCYFFFTNILIVAGHGLAGLWTPPVLWLWLYSTPLVALGIYLGEKSSRHIPKELFQRFVYGLLIVAGLLFLVSSGGVL